MGTGRAMWLCGLQEEEEQFDSPAQSPEILNNPTKKGLHPVVVDKQARGNPISPFLPPSLPCSLLAPN